jgi:signal recognition particle-docking protein FtsY
MLSIFKRKKLTEETAPEITDEKAETVAEERAPQSAETTATEKPKRSWRDRLAAGLSLSRQKLNAPLSQVFSSRKLDAEALETLEEALLMADVGIAATTFLLDDVQQRYRAAGADADVKNLLREALVELLMPLETSAVLPDAKPCVVMLAGVNGAGKTTSIGKLTKRWQNEGYKVLLAAGDTFRAAAGEQLSVWGQRNDVAVIAQQGGDPAAVMFDAVQAARARDIDIMLADTAGRLPTQTHLMKELEKIKRVIGRAQEGAPHEIFLVIDANTGQNALAQVKTFDAAVGLTGLIVTKLDGSAKGGVLAAIAREHPIPVKFIGVGEGIDDLQPFNAREFIDALLP